MLSLCVMLGYYCLTDFLADPMLDIPSLYHSVSWKWCDVSIQTYAEQTIYVLWGPCVISDHWWNVLDLREISTCCELMQQ